MFVVFNHGMFFIEQSKDNYFEMVVDISMKISDILSLSHLKKKNFHDIFYKCKLFKKLV